MPAVQSGARVSPASDCFETFLFPKPDPRDVISELEAEGQQLYETRARHIVDTNRCLTKTYNATEDPVCYARG